MERNQTEKQRIMDENKKAAAFCTIPSLSMAAS
jgi:hypothetical protein